MNASDYFLSCDWGTTVLRVRLVDAENNDVIAAVSSKEGIATVFQQWKETGKDDRLPFYLSILQKHILSLAQKTGSSLQGLPVILSGMASSSIGLMELPYKESPFSVDGSDLGVKRLEASVAFPHPLLVISGVNTMDDVMRGEETQLVGCASLQELEEAERIFLFPGTHSKHITVAGSKAIAFRTYMTGEVFALLSQTSILAASVQESEASADETNWQAFGKGVLDSGRQSFLHACFLVRTNQLFGKMNKVQNYHYLSGLVIGTELQPLLQGKSAAFTLVSNEVMKPFYETALQLLFPGRELRWEDADAALVTGQCRVYTRWKEYKTAALE